MVAGPMERKYSESNGSGTAGACSPRPMVLVPASVAASATTGTINRVCFIGGALNTDHTDQHGLDLQQNGIREIREIRGLKNGIRATRARRPP